MYVLEQASHLLFVTCIDNSKTCNQAKTLQLQFRCCGWVEKEYCNKTSITALPTHPPWHHLRVHNCATMLLRRVVMRAGSHTLKNGRIETARKFKRHQVPAWRQRADRDALCCAASSTSSAASRIGSGASCNAAKTTCLNDHRVCMGMGRPTGWSVETGHCGDGSGPSKHRIHKSAGIVRHHSLDSNSDDGSSNNNNNTSGVARQSQPPTTCPTVAEFYQDVYHKKRQLRVSPNTWRREVRGH